LFLANGEKIGLAEHNRSALSSNTTIVKDAVHIVDSIAAAALASSMALSINAQTHRSVGSESRFTGRSSAASNSRLHKTAAGSKPDSVQKEEKSAPAKRTSGRGKKPTAKNTAKPDAAKPATKKQKSSQKKSSSMAKSEPAKKSKGATRPAAKTEPKSASAKKKPAPKKKSSPDTKKPKPAKPVRKGAAQKKPTTSARQKPKPGDKDGTNLEEKTLEEKLEEELSSEDIENFQIEKVDMERLTNRVCDIIANKSVDGMLQGLLWKRLKISSRDGARLALRMERRGIVTREKILEKGRWTYKLILKKTPVSTESIENAPCLNCKVEAMCSTDGEISPKTCELIEAWVMMDAKR